MREKTQRTLRNKVRRRLVPPRLYSRALLLEPGFDERAHVQSASFFTTEASRKNRRRVTNSRATTDLSFFFPFNRSRFIIILGNYPRIIIYLAQSNGRFSLFIYFVRINTSLLGC